MGLLMYAAAAFLARERARQQVGWADPLDEAIPIQKAKLLAILKQTFQMDKIAQSMFLLELKFILFMPVKIQQAL